jgi:6-pyruvoyltetrahydropterin/6-carboxytetrahydropterin synthase
LTVKIRLIRFPALTPRYAKKQNPYLCRMIYLSRHEHFNAAHKLANPAWSEEKNREVFGKCANANWHGHNYELIVTVKGEVDPDTGFLMDAKRLSELVQEHVCEKIDHRNLNVDVPFMQGRLPSTENLAIAIWEQLEPRLPANVKLHCVKLRETASIYVEYYGQ